MRYGEVRCHRLDAVVWKTLLSSMIGTAKLEEEEFRDAVLMKYLNMYLDRQTVLVYMLNCNISCDLFIHVCMYL